MADEEKKEEELDTSEESSTEETSEEEKTEGEEPKVPLSRLREERDKRKKLETELKTKKEGEVPSEGRKEGELTFGEKMEEYERQKGEKEAKALEEFNEKLEDLKEVDPTLDDKALSDIIEKYGVDVDKAFKIYVDLKGGKAPTIKPKMPTGSKTTDEVKEEPAADVTKKSMHELVQDGLKKFGVGK